MDTSGLPIETLQPRAELVRRRTVRQAWFLVAAGLLIPFFALGGALYGWHLREAAPRQAVVLMVLGVAVFGTRMALYLG